jgi:hypothetical protein
LSFRAPPTSKRPIDEEQVQTDARDDGILGLFAQARIWMAQTVTHAYKMLWMVEAIFRTAKSIFDTHPICHKCDMAIRGHVFCSFLALVSMHELEPTDARIGTGVGMEISNPGLGFTPGVRDIRASLVKVWMATRHRCVMAVGLRCGIKGPKQAFQYSHEQEALGHTARHDTEGE